MVTIHETVHQYFYGILGNNEFEHSWLDEGFTTYVTARIANAAYGSGYYYKNYLEREGFGIPLTFSGISIDHRDWMIQRIRERGDLDFIGKRAWEFHNYPAYRAGSYEKPALMLFTLENMLGDRLWSEIMRTYVQRFQFQHPTPQDFIGIVKEFSPRPMDDFFEQILNEPGFVDYAVTNLSTKETTMPRGLFGAGEEREYQKKETEETLYVSQVEVRRLGTYTLPVDVAVTFEDGEIVTERWDGRDRMRIFQYEGAVRVVSAQVDPDRIIMLDVNPANNGRFADKDAYPAIRWATQFLFWLQDLLETITIFS